MMVESVAYDEQEQKWKFKAKNIIINETNIYHAQLIVVLERTPWVILIPDLPGLDSLNGEDLHSSDFKSGMEIAHDIDTHGATATISVSHVKCNDQCPFFEAIF